MEFVKKYKSLLIASAVGLILSIAVASDESSGLNVFQAFASAEVVILIVYFIISSKKKKAAAAAEAQRAAQVEAAEAAAKEQARWNALSPEEQMVELKKKEIDQSAAMHQESMKMQQSSMDMQAAYYSTIKKCPKCGSTSISGNRKGETFFTGILFSKKVYCTCMNCGYRWKAGKK